MRYAARKRVADGSVHPAKESATDVIIKLAIHYTFPAVLPVSHAWNIALRETQC
jgi:hypothetical protein